MPTYDYLCQDCGYKFEKFQSMTDDVLTTCPQCSKPALKRLIGAGAGLVFKGSGFYLTDYKKSSSSPAVTSDSSKSTGSDSTPAATPPPTTASSDKT